MKMLKEHQEKIEKSIRELLASNNHTFTFVANHILDSRAYVTSPAKSAIWLLFKNAKINGGTGVTFICDTLYNYLDDSHINTFLMKLAMKLQKEDEENEIKK